MNTLFVVLCAVGLECEVIDQRIIGGNYVRGPSGTVYVAGYGPYTVPNSATHTNITLSELSAVAPQLPTIGKSVAISGIADPTAFMSAMGMVRCDADGKALDLGLETLGETP